MYQELDENHIWADPKTQLLAAIATASSRQAYVHALAGLNSVPEEWSPVRYGPPVTEADGHVSTEQSVETTRANGAALHNML